MGVVIAGVEPGTPAFRTGLAPGQVLERIDGQVIEDVLDYRFYITSKAPTLELSDIDGSPLRITLRKREYEDIGLIFDSYLMDKQKHCQNRCVFCFIDQLPAGMRESLYFKDDDARMSFLFGSYVTLTNLSERDIRRIIKMRISPVNVSVHTTDPDLRVRMMGNPRAGEVMERLKLLAEGGIRLNAQLVLCPGLNDGEALARTLEELSELVPGLQSVAAVPVGLTAHREGLAGLRAFTREEAFDTVGRIEAQGDRMLSLHRQRVFYAADEFYLLAGKDIPGGEYYGAYDQLENGVGLYALLKEEFRDALENEPPRAVGRTVAVATGQAAYPLITELAGAAERKFPGLCAPVIEVENLFFGGGVTVAGLVTGGDLLRAVKGRLPGGCESLLIPSVMLNHDGELFLDDISVSCLEKELGIPVTVLPKGGEGLLDALTGAKSGQAGPGGSGRRKA